MLFVVIQLCFARSANRKALTSFITAAPFSYDTEMTVEQHPIRWLPVSWTVGFMTLFLAITTYINNKAPEEYMDEPFHVPMTQLYCKGNFSTWDPKITTFPGLYVIGAAYAWLSSILLSRFGVTLDLTCSGPYLRSLNALLAVAILQVAYAITCELQHQRASNNSIKPAQNGSNTKGSSSQHRQYKYMATQRETAATGVALAVTLLPTQLFFAFLFYTDVPSLLFLLITELLLLRGATHAAALAGAAAIGMRQTNAVWVTFVTGAAVLRGVTAAVHKSRTAQQQSESAVNGEPSPAGVAARHEDKLHPQDASTSNSSIQLSQLLSGLWQSGWALLRDYCLLLVLPAAFMVFVVLNKGITLGDREAHAPTLHFMQPWYFALFVLVNAAPLLLQRPVIGQVRAAIAASPRLVLVAVATVTVAALLCVRNYTLVHPYLLADNRHYTFYIWRRIFEKHWCVRYLFAPVYVIAWGLLLTALLAAEHWLWVGAYVVSCLVTLVPAWLVEFRYFTAPFALAVLHMPVPAIWASMMVAAAYCCVHALTIWVFVEKPYTWGDGTIARFMW